MEEVRWKMADGRWMMWLCAALFTIHCSLFTSCKQEDDVIVYKDSRRWVEKTVAVVAPLNDPIMKARLERTAEWMLSSLHNAQLHDTLCIDLKLEWYDEYGNDLKSLGERLANRDDLMAVIGPFDSDNVDILAPYCQQTLKPLILPTASSETVIRRFAISNTGDSQQPFLWSLTETDVTLSELLMSIYAHYLSMNNGGVGARGSNSALFAPADTYGQTFIEWVPFHADELGIGFCLYEQYANDESLYQDYRQYLNELPGMGVEVAQFVVAQNVEQIYRLSRLRVEWMETDPDDPTYDEYLDLLTFWAPVYYACANITEEAIAALGPRGIPLTNGYQGFSPYADPMTGFELSYETRYGTKPTFAECKFYDALLLAAFAASYMEHRPNVDDLNKAIIDICTTDNLLSGHGRSKATNGIDEMAWRDLPTGQGMTASLLSETLQQMADQKQFRQMLVCLEPCYSANMGKALEGIPGVLAICSAGAYEQSFADSWSSDLNVWMCDRFSRNLVGHASSNPDGTYRDLYLYCAQHTLGSHVGIYNYTNFGNLYTTSPKDFFVKR